ncbi:MAG: RagB/SusD family nutrient uptake outer membrane protein [Bacteroidetes bacterium]|nr:RagB/SusD family nutrient uptake outer membrane protein [Bacteroidota bacterium]
MKTSLSFIQFVIMLLALSLASCSKDFLEIKPKSKVIVQTTSDYDLMLNASGLVSNGVDVGVPMGDEIVAMDNYFSASSSLRGQRMFRWEDVIYDDGIFANEMATLMTNTYVYNKVTTEVMSSTDGTDAQKKALLAEAKAGRAMNNFMLINMYGKPYNAATAATDPGYPIVTAADVSQTVFVRASVQAMYDFIIKDLTEAIPDLPVTIKSRIRIGRAAAEEALGKVYVFMGKYAEAKTQLDAAVNDLANTGQGTALTNMALYDLNTTMVVGGTWGYNPATQASGAFSGTPTQANYTENIYCRSVATNFWTTAAGSEYVLSPTAAQLYSSSDKRLNYFTNKPYGVTTAYPLAGALRRNGPAALPNGMTIPELYMLRAECRARLNDLAGAKADLEILRMKRMSASEAVVPATLTQTQMIQFVLNERIREFALQGYRWFDMRRLSVDPLFAGTTYTHSLYSSTGTLSATYTLRPERFTMRLPSVVIAQNPGMENNP